MDFDNSRLAARLKAALEEQASADLAAREGADRAMGEGAVARVTLLDGLAAFAIAIGHLEMERTAGGGVLLRREAASMSFEPEAEGSGVRVAWDRAPHRVHRLGREVQLAGRWVWEETFAGRTERRPFDEKALEDLLHRALDLPRVGEGDPERPMSARTAAAMLSLPAERAEVRGARPDRAPAPDEAPAAQAPAVSPDGTRRRRL